MLALVALLAAPLPAAALWEDRVEIFAAENITWDSNLFRLSSASGNVQSDRYATTSLGITGDIPWSLQRFQFAYTWFTTRYRENSALDFDGHTARVAWIWAVTPRLTGDVGAGESQSLASFAQFVGDRSKDVLKTRQAYANAVWTPTPTWRVHGAAGASDQKHDDPTRKIFDIQTVTGETGLTYVTTQDNRIGVALRFERGKTLDPVVSVQGTVDNSYRQRGIGLVGHYTLTGHSMVDGRVDYTKRDYDVDPRRDFSGPTLRLTHTWTPTAKIEVLTTLRREISPIDEVQSSNFVLVKGISVKPKWLITDKITLTGAAEYATWEYRSDPLVAADYTHKVRSLGMGIAYRPTRRFTLQAGYLHEKRTSTLSLADYLVDLYTVEGRISF